MKYMYFVLLYLSMQQIISAQNFLHTHSKRFVPPIVFPPTAPTRVQLIFGVGIPEEDLKFESLTNGWVLKYEYFLPSNVTQLYVPDRLNIAGRSIADNIEKYDVEVVEIESGFDESSPILDMDIDANGLNKIDTDFEELSEIRANQEKHLSKYRWAIYRALEAAINRKGFSGRTCVLKSICDAALHPFDYQNGIFAELVHILLTPTSSVDELSSHSDNEYFHAEVLGQSGAPCDVIFKDCKRSFMDLFTNTFNEWI